MSFELNRDRLPIYAERYLVSIEPPSCSIFASWKERVWLLHRKGDAFGGTIWMYRQYRESTTVGLRTTQHPERMFWKGCSRVSNDLSDGVASHTR